MTKKNWIRNETWKLKFPLYIEKSDKQIEACGNLAIQTKID